MFERVEIHVKICSSKICRFLEYSSSFLKMPTHIKAAGIDAYEMHPLRKTHVDRLKKNNCDLRFVVCSSVKPSLENPGQSSKTEKIYYSSNSDIFSDILSDILSDMYSDTLAFYLTSSLAWHSI